MRVFVCMEGGAGWFIFKGTHFSVTRWTGSDWQLFCTPNFHNWAGLHGFKRNSSVIWHLFFGPWKRVQAGSYLLQWCVLYLYGSVWCWEGTKGYAWSTQFPSWSLGLRFKSSELLCTEKNGWGLAIWSPSGASSWLWRSISLSYDNSWIELVISPNSIQQAWRRNHHRSCNALQKRQKSTHKIGKKLHSQHTSPQWF